MADPCFDGYGTLGFAPGGIIQCQQSELNAISNAYSKAAYASQLAQYQQASLNRFSERSYDPVFAQKAAPAAPTKEPDVATNDSLIPDISLARVLKWAVVLLIAMALGRKVWDQFGDKITKQMHKALDAAS